MKKGNTIHEFLQKCLESLRKDFKELRGASVDGLMYIKEDLIIPHVSIPLHHGCVLNIVTLLLFIALLFLRFHNKQSKRKER